tara:strand:+ start:570 stop:683 length:114 start_codon:yes stop_codon:yes gene_type:complete
MALLDQMSFLRDAAMSKPNAGTVFIRTAPAGDLIWVN